MVDQDRRFATPEKSTDLLMLPQRVIFGIGLAVLLIISAASISLDIKSRSDAAWVAHTFEVLNKISEVRLLVRRAESAVRGFGLMGDPGLADEYRKERDRIGPALAELRPLIADNPEQTRLLDETAALAERRLGVLDEFNRLKSAGDSAAIDA